MFNLLIDILNVYYRNIKPASSDNEKCFIKNIKFAMILTFGRDYTCSTNIKVKDVKCGDHCDCDILWCHLYYA